MRRVVAITCAALMFLGAFVLATAQGDNDRAILDYSRIIEANPNSAETWWLRGNAYWDKGDYDRALADYNQAIEVDANYAMAYLGRGNVYLRKGDYDGALEEYNQVIEILPEFIGTYNNMGVAYREKGQCELAIQNFDLALGWKPDFAEALHNRGLTYRDMGEHELAAQDLKRAVELNPNLAKATDNRGAAPGDGKGGRVPALENPKNAAELKAKLSKNAGGRMAVNRKKGGKGRVDQEARRALEPEAKPTEARPHRLTKVAMMLCGLPVAVAILIGLVLLRRRSRL
jgi:tetratricopeptide (TPR) repeat protein